MCDGYTDCVHNDDESGCGEEGEGGEGSGGCPHESHACPSDPSVCVWWEQVCDGYADCPGLKLELNFLFLTVCVEIQGS